MKKKPNTGKPRPPGEHRPIPPDGFLDRVSRFPFAIPILLTVILACYYHTLSFDYTRLDDDLLVLENVDFYKDLGNIGQSFTKDAFNSTGHGFYRPAQNLSFFFDARLSGADPFGYKATNLALHCLTCISLLWLFQCLGLDRRLSFLGVLAYSVHPLFNHAVIWIPARGDLLIAMSGVLSYAGFVKYYRTGKAGYFVLNAAALLLAVFSKETAILLPLMFGMHVMLLEKGTVQGRRLWLPGISAIAVMAAYLACRNQVVTNSISAAEYGLAPFFYNLRTIPELVSKFLLPVSLSVMPLFGVFATVSGLIGLGILLWMSWDAARKKQNAAVFGMAWFLVFTAVTMLYRHRMGQAAYDYLEHRAYLPAIGALLCLIAFAQARLKDFRWGPVMLAGLAVTAAFSAGTWFHSRKYQNTLTFYGSAIESNPRCAVAFYNRAKYRRSLGDRAGAMADYDEAIRVKPDCADAYNNRGNARRDGGDLQGAMLDYNEAIRFDSRLASAYFNRGNARIGSGDRQLALEDFSKAISLEPGYQKAFLNRGAVYYELGQLDLAIDDFSRAIQVKPNLPDAWRNRGSARFRQRDVQGACSDWKAAAARGSVDAARLVDQHCK